MDKRFWTTAFAFIAAAISACAVGFSRADFSANAQQAQSVQDTLIAPASYEQYLSLSSPTDVAVSDDYTAIAQGNTVYLYDRTKNEYEKIDFSTTILKLQFSNGFLYYLDTSPDGQALYCIDPKNPEIENIQPIQEGLSNFLVVDDTLFYANAGQSYSTIYKKSAQSPVAGELLADKIAGLPTLAFYGGELYYTIDTQITLLFKINPQDKQFTQIQTFPQQTIHDLSISNGTVAFTIAETEHGGDFYTYALTDFSAPIAHEEGTFSSVTAHGDYFYTIEENSVKQYSLQTQAFTDYEICGASNSTHRLDGAKATCLSGDTLFIADNGNNRISIYNTATAQFEAPIQTDLQPLYLSAQDNTLLIANATNAELYDLASKTLVQAFDDFNSNIVGVACVYGAQYIATDSNHYYALTQDESGAWTVTETHKTSTQIPKLFTADVYGNLYILSGKKVYSFSEAALKDASAQGEFVCTLSSADIQQIAVDYNQTVYALSDNKIITENGEYAFETPLVYTADGTTDVTAFAFGVLQNTAYLLMNETYMLSTARLQLPTVQTIAVENADGQIFASASAEFSVLQTNENTLLVEFDIEKLNGATHFPYLTYSRASQSITALKMGETQTHYVIAHFNESKNAYQTYLVRKTDCTFMAGDTFRTDYAEDKRTLLYVTNDVALYKFPYLTDLLTVTALPRGASVTVLGEIRQLDHEYYQVQYVDENGNTLVGYIPKAFTNPFSGLPMPEHSYQAGAEQSDTDAVWRLAYILLGFGAICILVDYLLLRKKKPTEYETDDNNEQV